MHLSRLLKYQQLPLRVPYRLLTPGLGDYRNIILAKITFALKKHKCGGLICLEQWIQVMLELIRTSLMDSNLKAIHLSQSLHV